MLGTKYVCLKMKLEIKPISEKDLERFHELRKGYGSGHETWEDTKDHFEKWSSLMVGAYLNKKLIGVALGTPSEDFFNVSLKHSRSSYVVLRNIMIEFKYWRKGLGSKLLRYFESQVHKIGRKRVTVGAAENVDGFYLANGYEPFSYLHRLRPS